MNKNMRHEHPTVRDAYRGENARPDCLMVGVFAACPVDQAEMVAIFHSLSIV